MPIFFDLPSFCFKYFHTYQSPNGGKNKLTEYTVICLDNHTEEGLSLCGFPQLGHGKASSDISCPHSLHFISAIYFISFYQKTVSLAIKLSSDAIQYFSEINQRKISNIGQFRAGRYRKSFYLLDIISQPNFCQQISNAMAQIDNIHYLPDKKG